MEYDCAYVYGMEALHLCFCTTSMRCCCTCAEQICQQHANFCRHEPCQMPFSVLQFVSDCVWGLCCALDAFQDACLHLPFQIQRKICVSRATEGKWRHQESKSLIQICLQLSACAQQHLPLFHSCRNTRRARGNWGRWRSSGRYWVSLLQHWGFFDCEKLSCVHWDRSYKRISWQANARLCSWTACFFEKLHSIRES